MTTTVTVKACCTPPIEVQVEVSRGGQIEEHALLQNGQERSFYAYDDRVIRVREVTPTPEPT